MPDPIISARGLGIRFSKSRRKKSKLREYATGRNKLSPAYHGNDFWPLRDVTFDIFPGEAVGVIGRNGTGKSTLLKLIAGVLIPDEGTVVCHGRVAPLLELSAGFSGDLTGRDNVHLVGAMHGLSRAELRRKFDAIVEFAGVEEFIDMPVRHYSSGMKVRLGFAVLTQLPHPVMLVDEALAVGDKDFRKKCYETITRMLDEGRTLVFVSHSEADLTRFCKRGLFLDGGRLVVDGTLDEALVAYRGEEVEV
ncbi:MAG TPA: ABC transporter ATP-binding protein [Micromonosporaceae bacterium]|nr:ABC transporter ATP-binding protein [Micromonosporaceae bacterium]